MQSKISNARLNSYMFRMELLSLILTITCLILSSFVFFKKVSIQAKKKKLSKNEQYEQQRKVQESFRRALPTHLKIRSKQSRTLLQKNSKAAKGNPTSEENILYSWKTNEQNEHQNTMWPWMLYIPKLIGLFLKATIDTFLSFWDHKDSKLTDMQHRHYFPTSHKPKTTGIENVAIIAIDCEMVGVGFRGKESMLARCSIVRYIPNNDKNEEKKHFFSVEESMKNIEVIYDSIVFPTKRVVDYRTKYSGITPEMFRHKNSKSVRGGLPLVTFSQCIRDVSSILASLDGKPVLVVGHDIRNDFAVLRLTHPETLVRDTSYYRPLMRQVRRKYYKQKLAFLAKNELGISIQNGSIPTMLSSSTSKSTSTATSTFSIGHSSVEDATATLLIYLRHHTLWELSLKYPLYSISPKEKSISIFKWQPLTLYLDGCNLPMGLRRLEKKGNTKTVQYQLISKTTTQGTTEVFAPFDWIPPFQSSFEKSDDSQTRDASKFESIVIMLDGNMYRNCKEDKRPNQNYNITSNIEVEITDIGIQVDDVLVEKCKRRQELQSQNTNKTKNIVSIQKVVEYFEQGQKNQNLEADIAMTKGDHLEEYFIVRRKGGGSKIHKKLFGKLNLRRPAEGALCLTALTPRLHKHSLMIAKELERARVHGIVEYEMRQRAHALSGVVTNDILLADRLAKLGAIVLNYEQMQQLF